VTHYDGNDVLVLDDRGVRLSSVDEVRVESDRAVVMLKTQQSAWIDPEAFSLLQTHGFTIHSSHDGTLRWHGPGRLVCV
jgi:hypothetical protein